MMDTDTVIADMPLFPLQMVLFPGGVMPLRIFEPRYVDMIGRCMREGSGFVVVAIREGREVGGGATFYELGTLVRIIDFDRLEGGLLGITIEGVQKVRIGASHVRDDHLRLAEITPLASEPDSLLPVEFSSLASLLQNILQGLGGAFEPLQPRLDDAGWVANRLTELLPLSLPVKQALFEIPDPLSRLLKLSDDLVNVET